MHLKHEMFIIPSFSGMLLVSILGCLWTWGTYSSFSAFYSVAAFAIIIIYFYIVFLYSKPFFIISFTFIISFILVIGSNSYIEFGKYISEQGVWGEANGATIRLAFYVLIYFLSLNIIFLLFLSLRNREIHCCTTERIINHSYNFNYKAVGYSWILFFSSLGVLIVYGSPLLDGKPRFQYWIELPGFISKVRFLIGFGFYILGVAKAASPRLNIYIPIIGLIIVLVLFAEKFTMLYTSMLFYFTGYYTIKFYCFGVFPNVRKLLFWGLIGGSILLISAGAGYYYLHNYSINDIPLKIIDRILGLQGHVWYGVDRLALTDQTLASPYDLLRNHSEDRPAGLVMLMWQIAPANLVEVMRELNIRFTMGNPAIALSTLGYFGTFFYQLIAAVISAIVLFYLFKVTVEFKFFRILIALIGFKMLMNAFLMGEVYALFKPLGLLFWFLLIIDLLLEQFKHFSKKSCRG